MTLTKCQIITEYAARVGYFCRMLEIGVDYGDTWHHCKGAVHDYTGVDITLSRVAYPIIKSTEPPVQYESIPDQRPLIEGSFDPRARWYEMKSSEFWQTLDARVLWNLIFVDGDHSTEIVFDDIQQAVRHLAPRGYVLVHDIDHVGGGPYEAFKKVRNDLTGYDYKVIGKEIHDLGLGVIWSPLSE